MSYEAEDADRDLELMKRDPGYGAALDERLMMWLVRKEIDREKMSVYMQIKDEVMAARTDGDLRKVARTHGFSDPPEAMTFTEGYSPKGCTCSKCWKGKYRRTRKWLIFSRLTCDYCGEGL